MKNHIQFYSLIPKKKQVLDVDYRFFLDNLRGAIYILLILNIASKQGRKIYD